MDDKDSSIIRCELEMAQRALKLQTRRCRQLVSEFTKKLQDKELQVLSERRLRDEQLTKVLRSLLVFEARLKQEQTFIKYQLEEKDDVIRRQRKELGQLQLTVQYCKTCSQFYTADSSESGSSEYCLYSEHGSDLYSSISEKSWDEMSKPNDNPKDKITYEKNKQNRISEGSKPCKRSNGHRRTTGTYFEVLKMRESESSVDDQNLDPEINTSENLKLSKNWNEFSRTTQMDSKILKRHDSTTESPFNNFPKNDPNASKSCKTSKDRCKATEMELEEATIENFINVSQKVDQDFNIVSERIEELFTQQTNKYSDRIDNMHGIKRINDEKFENFENAPKSRLISDTITVFDSGEDDQNENWYVSGSEAEDEDQKDIYRNNPVLECMNQILMQSINSPPKSPDLERGMKTKSQKRVKFSDESKETLMEEKPVHKQVEGEYPDYYETPIQVGTNFYEVPQSIYSNDYEQILSKCSDSSHNYSTPQTSKIENLEENKINRMSSQKLTLVKCHNFDEIETKSQHLYVDMDTSASTPVQKVKTKKIPPALPPKPANLLSKFKIQTLNKSSENVEEFTLDSEPDYCSISELNLPTEKIIMSASKIALEGSMISGDTKKIPVYDPISLDGPLSSLVTKNAEKNSLQAPKQPQTKTETVANIAQITMLKPKIDSDIPKLPQVSEIIIPEETIEVKKVDHIAQDNYIKNNSQLLKQQLKMGHEKFANRIVVGTSVSSLVSSFNNQHLLEVRKVGNSPRRKSSDKLLTSFDYGQNNEKQPKQILVDGPGFDLSQTFEEFNLDDCEIGEEFQSETGNDLEVDTKSNTAVEIVRVTKDITPQNIQNLQLIQKNLISQRENHEPTITASQQREHEPAKLISQRRDLAEPSYEHFLECTGLSSKSILTPSRILSNHKAMLKPKDIKLRSRVKSTSVFERPTGTIKYWSEPYL